MAFIRALKTVNYRLMSAILATMLIPTVYQTVRIFFLGDLPSDGGINIASQMQWVSLFYEVVQEALILPLFYILGQALGDRNELANRVRTGVAVTTAIYAAVSIFVIAFARPLVVAMAQNERLIGATVEYVRLETVASLAATVWRFVSLVLVTLKKDGCIYILLAARTALSVAIDAFLISQLPFSLNIGVNGIAIGNIIVNGAIIILAFFLLKREGISLFARAKWSFSWLKEWFRVGKFSGIESLLRNLAFSVMVVRMVNLVSEQGNYWICNNFIWNWLLLPGLALADLVKKEVGESRENIRGKTAGYIAICSIFCAAWLLSIPLWKPFLRVVMNVQEYETVFYIALLETAFYLTFLFNSCILDSTFYGLGRTDYMLIQPLCIGGFYCGVIFIPCLADVFVPTLAGIALMFGIGITAGFMPALILYIRMLKKENIRIDFALEAPEPSRLS